MPRTRTPSFVHTFEIFPLEKGCGSFRDLEISSDFYRKLYNAVLGILHKTARELKASPEWDAARNLPRKTGEERKLRSEKFQQLRITYGLTKNHAEKLVKNLASGSPDFSGWTNSAVNQRVAERAIRAVDRYIYARAKRVRFKRKGEAFSFEGKSNKTGVRIVERDG